MQTVQLKYDIISLITGVNDHKLIQKLYAWAEQQKVEEVSVEGIPTQRSKGSLTDGYGMWTDDAPFDENNYRDWLWRQKISEKSIQLMKGHFYSPVKQINH